MTGRRCGERGIRSVAAAARGEDEDEDEDEDEESGEVRAGHARVTHGAAVPTTIEGGPRHVQAGFGHRAMIVRSSGMLWLLGVALIGSAIVSTFTFYYRQRGERGLIRALVAAPEDQVVRVRGRVSCERALTAPLTGRPCVYYRIEYRSDVGSAITTSLDAEQVDFIIDDGSSLAQILVERASFEIVADIFETGRASQISNVSAAALAERGWYVPEIARIEVCEAIVAVNSEIDVIGQLTREPEPNQPQMELGYRSALPTRLVFASGHRVVEKPRERRYIGTR